MRLTFLLGSLPDGSTLNGRPAAGEVIVLAHSGRDVIEEYRAQVQAWKAKGTAYKGFGILTVGPGEGCWGWVPLEARGIPPNSVKGKTDYRGAQERTADVLTKEILDDALQEMWDAGTQPPQRERVLIDPNEIRDVYGAPEEE